MCFGRDHEARRRHDLFRPANNHAGQTTPRQHSALTYGAGFLFYDPTTALNSVEQNAGVNYSYRFSPGASIGLHDSFQQSSNVFSSSSPLSGGAGDGAGGPDGAIVIAPFANQYGNSANVVFSYQFSQDGMIGGTGNSNILNYPNLSQVPGLYNSRAEGGSGFFNRRLTGSQYIGVTYKYSTYTTDPVESDTTTNTVLFFYSTHLSRSLSMSVSVGPQYHSSSEGGGTSTQSWGPAVTATVGWRGEPRGLNARYARSVYGGGGLLGTYETDSVIGNAHWQMQRYWSINGSAIYTNSRNVDPLQSVTSPGGDTATGTAALQHSMGEHFNGELGYARIHQNYNAIDFVTTAPNSDRVYISVSYQFTRPLGR